LNGPVDRAVRQFSRLPGVGRRSAQRFVYHLLRTDAEQAESLITAISSLLTDLRACGVCNRVTELETCDICGDTRRDQATICVVGETSDLDVIEQSGKYRGTYHVLGGLLNPAGGVGPEQLNTVSLIKRLESDANEVILALNASVEGETTSLYLTRLLKPTGVRVTGLARGLPAGGSLDHADKVTVGLSLDGRVEL
jgi:recombination protein RecR